MRSHATFILCFWSLFAFADTLEGTITDVFDGDMVKVKDARGKDHLFRLLGADAPENGQPGYGAAQKELYGHANGKAVTVDWIRAQICPPSGGRCAQLAKVFLKGEDLALRQIRRGLAWHDKRQLREQSTTDKTLYADAELQSRLRHRGLFKYKSSVPPWEYEPRDATQKASPKKKPPNPRKR